ncbi:MAG: 2-oxoglutarate and iron-dependent oxygenase domain-containing protein, partial [Ilumatobacteraceae bacterium]
MNPPAIPTVDLGAPDAAAQILHAYSTVGFAYLVGHGVPPQLSAAVFEASREFHASTIEQKRSIALNAIHRGFIEIDTSTDRNSTLAEVTKPNQSESFMMMREDAPDGAQVRAGHYLAGANQWPGWLPRFRPVLEEYHEAMVGLGLRVVAAVAYALSDDRGELIAGFHPPTTWLRLLHYPPHPPGAP